MKKYIALLVVLVMMISMVFTGIGCKSEPVESAEEVAEETIEPEEETVSEEATESEEAAEEVAGEETEGRDIAAMIKEKDNSMFEVMQCNKGVGHRWFTLMEEGIRQAGVDFGCKTGNVGPEGCDPAVQAQMFEDLVTRLEPEKSAVILVPNDPAALDSIAKKANDKGIATIGYEGTTLENISYDLEPYDNAYSAERMMERLAQEMGGEGEYAVAIAMVTMEMHKFLADTAVAYQKKNYPNMTLVTDPYVETYNDQSKGYTAAQELFKAHPNLKGVLACEGVMVASAAQVIEEKNLIGEAFVCGNTLPSEVYDFIKDGSALAGYCSNPTWQSYCLVTICLAILNGIDLQVGDYLGQKGYEIIRIDDGKILYANGLVEFDKDNIDLPEMDL